MKSLQNRIELVTKPGFFTHLADAEEDMIVQSAMPILIPTTDTYLVKE